MESLSGSLELPTLNDIERERARRAYARWLRAHIPPGWEVPSHIAQIGAELDRILSGESDRLAIAMPPRHGKTETTTVRFPARILDYEPSASILITGYNDRFARRLSRKARAIAITAGVDVTGAKSAQDEWETKQGGLVMARGVGSPPTGVGFKTIIIDDPIRRREDANSDTYRSKLKDWYTDDLITRLEPGGAIVLIQTRWHEDDLWPFAVGQEPGRWREVVQRAIDDDGRALWPERFDVDAITHIRDMMRRDMGDFGFEALYQQNPSPRAGSLFQVSEICFLDDAPPGPEVRRWDLAASAGDGDYTVGLKMRGPIMGGEFDGCYIVMDMVRGQWGTKEKYARMRECAERDGASTTVSIPQDPGSAGKDIVSLIYGLLDGYTVHYDRETGSKEGRAEPAASMLNAGNVLFLRGGWNADAVEELRQFRKGCKHDDIVDALAGGHRFLSARASRAGLAGVDWGD